MKESTLSLRDKAESSLSRRDALEKFPDKKDCLSLDNIDRLGDEVLMSLLNRRLVESMTLADRTGDVEWVNDGRRNFRSKRSLYGEVVGGLEEERSSVDCEGDRLDRSDPVWLVDNSWSTRFLVSNGSETSAFSKICP